MKQVGVMWRDKARLPIPKFDTVMRVVPVPAGNAVVFVVSDPGIDSPLRYAVIWLNYRFARVRCIERELSIDDAVERAHRVAARGI